MARRRRLRTALPTEQIRFLAGNGPYSWNRFACSGCRSHRQDISGLVAPAEDGQLASPVSRGITGPKSGSQARTQERTKIRNLQQDTAALRPGCPQPPFFISNVKVSSNLMCGLR
jgi:hypothetical protein